MVRTLSAAFESKIKRDKPWCVDAGLSIRLCISNCSAAGAKYTTWTHNNYSTALVRFLVVWVYIVVAVLIGYRHTPGMGNHMYGCLWLTGSNLYLFLQSWQHTIISIVFTHPQMKLSLLTVLWCVECTPQQHWPSSLVWLIILLEFTLLLQLSSDITVM